MTACRRAWRATCRSLCVDRVKSRGSVGAEAEPSWGGSAGVNPEAAETLKWIAEAWREQLVLYTDSEARLQEEPPSLCMEREGRQGFS